MTMIAPVTAPPAKESTVSGRSISPGLGMGRAWVIADVLKGSGLPAAIREDQVDHELRRLARSFEETLAELDEHARRIEGEFDAALIPSCGCSALFWEMPAIAR